MALLAMATSNFVFRQPGLAVAALSSLLVVAVPLLAASRSLGGALEDALRRVGLVRTAELTARVAAAVRGFVAAPRLAVGVLGLSIAMKIGVAATLVLLADSLELRLRWVDVLVFLPIHAAVSALPLSLNGLGVREANLIVVFRQLGLTATQATSLAVLHLIWLYLTALPGVFFITPRVRRSRAPD
jgi:uncharacterized membrane protein YbhN (UPF0104 family)